MKRVLFRMIPKMRTLANIGSIQNVFKDGELEEWFLLKMFPKMAKMANLANRVVFRFFMFQKTVNIM